MATAVVGCKPPPAFQEPPPPEVTVAEPLQQDVMTFLETTGTTAPVEIVEVRARVSGFLKEIYFMPPEGVTEQTVEGDPATEAAPEGTESVADGAGQSDAEQASESTVKAPKWLFEGPGADVEKGDVLFTIEPDVYEATLNQAKAALKVATAKAKDAEAKYKRAVPLAEKDVVSAEELYEKAAAYAVALAAIEAAKADVEKAELQLSYTTVVSPINGRVGETLVDRGNLVSEAEATQLTTVIRWDQIYASFNISDRDLLALREVSRKREEKQEPIPVFLRQENEKGFPHAGETEYYDLAVDTSTGTFMIRAIFENADKVILPGSFVHVRIPTGVLEQALFVPEAAVGTDQLGRYLLIVRTDSSVERRSVVLGAKYGEMILVVEGLKAGEQVIVEGLQRARPGAKVNPKTEPLTAPQELLDALPGNAAEDTTSAQEEPPAGLGNGDDSAAAPPTESSSSEDQPTS
jgi:membrane fusion protein (multidrug efflux system)